MRGYCRVYHTSMDYLKGMTMARLMEELFDATEELADERRRLEKEANERARRAKARPRRGR